LLGSGDDARGLSASTVVTYQVVPLEAVLRLIAQDRQSRQSATPPPEVGSSSQSQPGAANDGLLLVEEVARRCRVTQPTVRAWIHSGKLFARRIGRKYLIHPSDLAAFERVRAQEVAEGAPASDEQMQRLLRRIRG
jgi:excisionase family DNA binding protein